MAAQRFAASAASQTSTCRRPKPAAHRNGGQPGPGRIDELTTIRRERHQQCGHARAGSRTKDKGTAHRNREHRLSHGVADGGQMPTSRGLTAARMRPMNSCPPRLRGPAMDRARTATVSTPTCGAICEARPRMSDQVGTHNLIGIQRQDEPHRAILNTRNQPRNHRLMALTVGRPQNAELTHRRFRARIESGTAPETAPPDC